MRRRFGISLPTSTIKLLHSNFLLEKFSKFFDETKINFDMFGSTTLANCGERTIGLVNTGNSNRCTVPLGGVTMSGEKLTQPFIVFTGTTRDGRVARQFGLLDNNQRLFPVGIKFGSYLLLNPKSELI